MPTRSSIKRPAVSVVTTDSLSAVDSEVMPCTPAQSTRDARCSSGFLAGWKMRRKSLLDVPHQTFELLLVPCGQVGTRRHVMLEQKVPQARFFLREGQVRVRDPGHATVRVPLSLLNAGQTLVEGVEHARLDVEHHIVEVVEHVIDGAGRVADAACDLAGGKSGQAVDVDYFLCGVEDELAQLLWSVRRPSSHGHPARRKILNPCD